MKRAATTKASGTRTPTRLNQERLAAMIEEATLDAYDESEQATGWFAMLEEHLELPFETKVLGAAVTVASIDLRDGGQVVAVCTRGRDRQAISLADLPLPSPKPAGSDWIEAYRYWLSRR
jgi:calcium binding protein